MAFKKNPRTDFKPIDDLQETGVRGRSMPKQKGAMPLPGYTRSEAEHTVEEFEELLSSMRQEGEET